MSLEQLNKVRSHLKIAIADMEKFGGSPTFIFPEVLDYEIDLQDFREFISHGDKEVAKQLGDVETMMLLVFQPRSLYDYFDKKGIRIVIAYFDDTSEWASGFKEGELTSGFTSRIEAEKSAFLEAFRIQGMLKGTTDNAGAEG